MGTAQKYVTQSMNTVNGAVSSLQQALTTVEKPANKQKIEEAINSLNCACQTLNQYQD